MKQADIQEIIEQLQNDYSPANEAKKIEYMLDFDSVSIAVTMGLN